MNSKWETVLLGELCTLTKGKSPTLKTPPGEYPLVVTGPRPLSSKDFQFDGEAVCIPMVSSTGHGHASLKRVHYASGRFALANIVTAAEVIDSSKCDTRYLHLYLQHFKDELIVPRMQGTANVSLSQRTLGMVPVVLPPLAEQQRIVDLIGSLDDAIEAADEQMVSTRSLLTTHLSRLYEESECVQLGELGEIQIGFPFKSASFKDSGTRLLRGNNISPGALKWSGAQHVDSEDVTDRQQDYHLALGDIVIAMDAPIISSRVKASMVTQADLPSLLVQRVARIRVPQEDVRNAVALALHSSEFKSYLLRAQTGAFAPHITKSDISDFSIPRSLLNPENLNVGVALDERIKMTKASSDSLRKLRSELLTALLSGAHTIPESYDQPVLEIAA